MEVIDPREDSIKLRVNIGENSTVTYEDNKRGDKTLYCHGSIFDKKSTPEEFFAKSLEAIAAIQAHLENKTVPLEPVREDYPWWKTWFIAKIFRKP